MAFAAAPSQQNSYPQPARARAIPSPEIIMRIPPGIVRHFLRIKKFEAIPRGDDTIVVA